MMDKTDHTISKPCELEARISKTEFKKLLDEIFCVVRDRGDGYGTVDAVEQSDLATVEPFKAWISEWSGEGIPGGCK